MQNLFVFLGGFARKSYLCNVFFIVLDLRLTRLGYSGIPFFVPYWLLQRVIFGILQRFNRNNPRGYLYNLVWSSFPPFLVFLWTIPLHIIGVEIEAKSEKTTKKWGYFLKITFFAISSCHFLAVITFLRNQNSLDLTFSSH